jgi:hypothetical protein
MESKFGLLKERALRSSRLMLQNGDGPLKCSSRRRANWYFSCRPHVRQQWAPYGDRRLEPVQLNPRRNVLTAFFISASGPEQLVL